MSRSLLLVLIVIASPAPAEQFARVGEAFAWEGIFTGVSSEALGDADLAGGADGVGLLLNPASISDHDGIVIEYGHLNYVADIDLDNAGLALDLRGWRVAIATSSLSGDALIRTAYDPDGHGEYAEFRDRMTAVGVSYDLARLVAPGTDWRFALGTSYRHFHNSIEIGSVDEDRSGGTIDVGGTLGWRHRMDGAQFTAEASFVRQNVGDSTLDFAGVMNDLPRVWRCGLTVSAEMETLGFRAAVARSDDQAASQGEVSHVGLEVTVLDLVAGRLGHDSGLFDGTISYGAALIVDRAWLHPVSLILEWTRLAADDPPAAEFDSFDMFGLRGRLAL